MLRDYIHIEAIYYALVWPVPDEINPFNTELINYTDCYAISTVYGEEWQAGETNRIVFSLIGLIDLVKHFEARINHYHELHEEIPKAWKH